ncbi:MAG: hypothetical protein E4G93_06560 [Dehalococcoidia bacterium]|nr:MAG: hypothetical protein E4G93_06560 [Dehalococcoidia bacterium]
MPERSQWSWTSLNTGFWAAMLAAVWAVWFVVAYGLWMSRLPAWAGIDAYVSAFDELSYLAWVIPCFLLAITFPVLMAAVYLYLSADRRAPALVALVFASLSGAVLGATCFLLGTVVRVALLAGVTNGLELLVIGSPYSMLNVLESAGFLFMGLAMVFAGLAWRVPGRWRRATRGLLILNGVAGILAVAAGVLGAPAGWMIFLAVWATTFPVAAVLLALRFNLDLRVAPVSRVMKA